MKPDAIFIGYQADTEGKRFALYTIIRRGHPRYGSTVCLHTLADLNLRPPKDWRKGEMRMRRTP